MLNISLVPFMYHNAYLRYDLSNTESNLWNTLYTYIGNMISRV
jgi:hypothetical protein